MPDKRLQPVLMEGRRILFRNFSGEAGQYNAAGNRNFNVLLEPDEAAAMQADGWNVKYLEPREEGDERQARLEVSVSWKNRPPNVVLITSKGKTPLDESMVQILDWAEIISVDLIVNPYEWGPIQGRSGVKAYVKSLYVKIREDALELKYADTPDVPDSAQSVVTKDAVPDEAPF